MGERPFIFPCAFALCGWKRKAVLRKKGVDRLLESLHSAGSFTSARPVVGPPGAAPEEPG